MAKRIAGDKLRILYQTADQPGTAVGTSGTTGAIPYHDNTIQYREVPGNTFWPVGIGGKNAAGKNAVSQNYPNPVKGMTSFTVSLDQDADVLLEVSNIMGQRIMSIDKGRMSTGMHKMTIDGARLTAGVYFYTVRINDASCTHKMIVE